MPGDGSTITASLDTASSTAAAAATTTTVTPTSTLTFTLTAPIASSFTSPSPNPSERPPDSKDIPKFGPRLGKLTLTRSSSSDSDDSTTTTTTTLSIETPGLLTNTRRGVVPHISRDVYAQHAASLGGEGEGGGSGPLRWVNVPFETFFEHNPPVPVVFAEHLASTSTTENPASTTEDGANQNASKPLHTFLGFPPSNHILSLSARDPDDTREMPPNGNGFVNVATLRGVRKLTPQTYTSISAALNPDLIFALHDTPYTTPPYSQKRLTKSIERSGAWVGTLFKFGVGVESYSSLAKSEKGGVKDKASGREESKQTSQFIQSRRMHLPVIASLVGSTSVQARSWYAQSLLEPLYGPELDAIQPASGKYRYVDDGIAGYSVEVGALVKDLGAAAAVAGSSSIPPSSPPTTLSTIDSTGQSTTPTSTTSAPTTQSTAATPTTIPTIKDLTPLLHASLSPLSQTKPRIIFGLNTPHDILEMVRDVGVDVVEDKWAVEMGGVGIGLDFEFPVRRESEESASGERVGGQGKREIGHNLYSTTYVKDFGSIAECFSGLGEIETKEGVEVKKGEKEDRTCLCLACSPRRFEGDAELIRHGVDGDSWITGRGFISSSASSSSHGSPSTSNTSNIKSTGKKTYVSPHTRAYIHHLLHTHEMSAHAMLVSHNLAVVEAFMRGVRAVLASEASVSGEGFTQSTEGVAEKGNGKTLFEKEVETFFETYARPEKMVEEATRDWKEVDLARGKGRLGREAEVQAKGSQGV